MATTKMNFPVVSLAADFQMRLKKDIDRANACTCDDCDCFMPLQGRLIHLSDLFVKIPYASLSKVQISNYFCKFEMSSYLRSFCIDLLIENLQKRGINVDSLSSPIKSSVVPCNNIKFVPLSIVNASEPVVAHAISTDRAMGKGVAPLIRKTFMRNDNYFRRSVSSSVGSLFIEKHNDRFIIGLQSKLNYYDKPSLQDAQKSLYNLVLWCRQNSVNSVAIPLLWGGLDSRFIAVDDTMRMLNQFPDIMFSIYLGPAFSFAPKDLLPYLSIEPQSSIPIPPPLPSWVQPTYSRYSILDDICSFRLSSLKPLAPPEPIPYIYSGNFSSFYDIFNQVKLLKSILIPIPPPFPKYFIPVGRPFGRCFANAIRHAALKLPAAPNDVVNLRIRRPDSYWLNPTTVKLVLGDKEMKSVLASGISPDYRAQLLEKVVTLRELKSQSLPKYRVGDFILSVNQEKTIKNLIAIPAVQRYSHVRRLYLFYKTTSYKAFAQYLRRLMVITWDEVCHVQVLPQPDSYIHQDLSFTDDEPLFDPLNIPDLDPEYQSLVDSFYSNFRSLSSKFVDIAKYIGEAALFRYFASILGSYSFAFLHLPKYVTQTFSSAASAASQMETLMGDLSDKVNSIKVDFDLSSLIKPLFQSILTSCKQGLIKDDLLSHLMFFLKSAASHPIGVISCIYLMIKSSSMSEFVACVFILFSFFGVENLVMSKIVSRFFSVSYDEENGDTYHDPVFENASFDPFKDFLVSTKSWVSTDMWDAMKDYLIPLFATASCLGLGGDYLTKFTSKMHGLSTEISKFNKDITVFEDTLADVGIFTSARTKFISDLKKSLEVLVADLQMIEFQVNDKASMFCNDAEYSRVLSFEETLWKIRKNIAAHKYDKFITTTMNSEITALTRKFDKLKVKVDNVRSKNGTRVTPVGLVFQSPSGIGKSYMSSIFQIKLFAYLFALYKSDPQKYSMFEQAQYYTVWNVQSRDKYDTGYEGQDWHYNDDAFKEVNDLDHPAYVTWISNQKIGQVMSDNDDKGKDYKALGVHLCLNKYPKTSQTLRNKEALDNRFTFFYQVAAVEDRKPDASHLRFYRTDAFEIFESRPDIHIDPDMNCNDFRSDKSRERTMDQVVVEVANGMYNNYLIWRSRENAVIFDKEVERVSPLLVNSSPSFTPPSNVVLNPPPLPPNITINGVDVETKGYCLNESIIDAYDSRYLVKHNVPGDGLCGYHSLAFFLQMSVRDVIDKLKSSSLIHLFSEENRKEILMTLRSPEGSDGFYMTDLVLALAALTFGFSCMVHTGNLHSYRLQNPLFSRTFHFSCTSAHWCPVIVTFKYESIFNFSFKQEKSLCFEKNFVGFKPIRSVTDLFVLYPCLRKLKLDTNHPAVRSLNDPPERLIEFVRAYPDFFTLEFFFKSISKDGCLFGMNENVLAEVEKCGLRSDRFFFYDDATGIVSAYFENLTFISVPRQYVCNVMRNGTTVRVSFTRLHGFTGEVPSGHKSTWKQTQNAGEYTFDEDVNASYDFLDPKTFFDLFGYNSSLPSSTWKERLIWSYDMLTGSVKRNFTFWSSYNGLDLYENVMMRTLLILKSLPATLYTSFMYLVSKVLCLDNNVIWLILTVLAGGVVINALGIWLVTHVLSLLIKNVYSWWYYSFSLSQFTKLGSTINLNDSVFASKVFQGQYSNQLNTAISRFTLSYIADIRGTDVRQAEYYYLYELTQHLLNGKIGPVLRAAAPQKLSKADTMAYVAHLLGYYIYHNRNDLLSLVTNAFYLRFPEPSAFSFYFSDADSIVTQRNRMPSNPKYSHHPKLTLPSSGNFNILKETKSPVFPRSVAPPVTELLDYIIQPKTSDEFKSIRKNVAAHTTLGSVPTTNRTPLKMMPVDKKYAAMIDQKSFEEFGYIPHFIDSTVSTLENVTLDVPIKPETLELESFDMLKDRSSIDCLNSFRKRNIASICLNPVLGANSSTNQTMFGHTFYGWLHKYGMFSPAHGLALGDEAVVCPINPFSSDRSTYYIYRVILIDHESDLCLWRAVSPSAIAVHTRTKFNPTIIAKAQQPTQFPDIYKVLPLQSEIGDSNQHYSGLIFSASNSFAIPITLSYFGKVTSSTSENMGSCDFIVNQLQNYAVTGPGDCGSPLVVINPSSPRKLVGMHHLSQGGSITYSIITYRERLESMENALPANLLLSDFCRVIKKESSSEFQTRLLWSPKLALETPCNKISSLIDFETPKLTYLGTGNIIGVGDFKDESGNALELAPVRFRYNDPWSVVEGPERVKQKTPFFGCFEVDRHPSVLSPLDPRPTAWSHAPLINGKPNLLVGQTNLYQDIPSDKIDLDLLENMVSQVTDYFTCVMSGREVGICNVYEALKGNKDVSPNHEPMNLRSANGVPFNFLGKPSGHHLFSFEDDKVNLLCKEAHFCLDMAEEKVELANKGVRTFSIWKNCLKDELRPIEKVVDPKTRLFVAAPRDTTIAFRILFGRFKAVWTDLRDLLCHSVGVNVHSVEWGMLYERLNNFPHHFDVDFSAFDKRQLREFIIAVGYIVIETIDRISHDGFKQARWTLWMEIIDTFCISYDTVFMKKNANPSGNPMTTVLNCILHLLYLFYCYCKVMGTCDFPDFLKNVGMGIFGDDGCYGVSDAVFKRFNFFSIQKIMADIGQVITPGCKSDLTGDTFDVATTELVFLKRRFKPYKNGVIVMAPLNKESIEGMFAYSSIPFYDALTWKNTVMECMIEAAQHGPQYYLYFRNTLRSKFFSFNAIDKLHFAPLLPVLSYSYRVMFSLLCERYTGCSRSFIDFEKVMEIEFEDNCQITVDLAQVSGLLPLSNMCFTLYLSHLPRYLQSKVPRSSWSRLSDWHKSAKPGASIEIDGQYFVICVDEDGVTNLDLLDKFLKTVTASQIYFDLQCTQMDDFIGRLSFYYLLMEYPSIHFTLLCPFESIVHASRKEIRRALAMGGLLDNLPVEVPRVEPQYDYSSRMFAPTGVIPFNVGAYYSSAKTHNISISDVNKSFYVLDNPADGYCAWYSLGYWLAARNIFHAEDLDDLKKFVHCLVSDHLAQNKHLSGLSSWQMLLHKTTASIDFDAPDLRIELYENTLCCFDLELIMQLLGLRYCIVFDFLNFGTLSLGNDISPGSCFFLITQNHCCAMVPLEQGGSSFGPPAQGVSLQSESLKSRLVNFLESYF